MTERLRSDAKRPVVYLVGAGPGDPWLISVRGLRCLQMADVVVYDHLIHPRLLRSARPEAERIDVGAAAPGALEQDAISMLLAEKARDGNVVVRLKWGDPFVFDSGGKEALFLHEQGIRFEVVPGIPAATGVPCHAGVPVTYPDGGDILTLVRGHEAERNIHLNVDWKRLARLDGTIVCYAGARQLPDIIDALLSHGRPANEPAALVYNGTLPGQETVQGTLAEIKSAIKHTAHRRPAILIVGRVTALREHLRWFDARPLFGKRIVVTRSHEQAGELVEMLEELGAEAIEAPIVRIEPVEDTAALDKCCAEVGTFRWVIVASANASDHFLRRLLAGPGDVRDLKGVRICAIGPAAADQFARRGIKVDVALSEDRPEVVIEALRAHTDLRGARILFLHAEHTREALADELRQAGAQVVEVVAYRTVLRRDDRGGGNDIYRMLLDKQIDVVTFTGASTVGNFVRTLGAEPAVDLLRTTVVASIGPVTAEAAQQMGIKTTIMPSTYTLPALLDAIVDYFETRA